jgi:hypothetical protein
VLEITLTWVSGYRRSHRGETTHHSFARSRTLRIKLTFGFSPSTVFFDLAISTPLWIIAWIETIFIEFRGPKALVNLHGCRYRRSSGLVDFS